MAETFGIEQAAEAAIILRSIFSGPSAPAPAAS